MCKKTTLDVWLLLFTNSQFDLIILIKHYKRQVKIFIWDGNSKIGAHVWINLGNLLCLRHLIRSAAVAHVKFIFKKRPVFLHTCATGSELPANLNTMKWENSRPFTFFLTPTAHLKEFKSSHKCQKLCCMRHSPG